MVSVEGLFKGYDLQYTDSGTPILTIYIGDKDSTPIPIKFIGGSALPYVEGIEEVPIDTPAFAYATLNVRVYNGRSYINLDGVNFGIFNDPVDFKTSGAMMAQVLSVQEGTTKNGKTFKTATVQPYLNARQELAPTVDISVKNIDAPGVYTILFTVSARTYNDRIYLNLREFSSELVSFKPIQQESVPF